MMPLLAATLIYAADTLSPCRHCRYAIDADAIA